MNLLYPLSFLVVTVFIYVSTRKIITKSLRVIWIILPIKNLINDKVQDFLFQLPNLIMPHRNQNKTDDLRILFMKLSDNKALSTFDLFADVTRWMLFINNFTNSVVLICGLACAIFAILGINIGWTSQRVILYMWSVTVCMRCNFKINQMMQRFVELIKVCTNLISIHNFLLVEGIEDDPYNSGKIERIEPITYIRSHKLETYAIMFRKVYMTMGHTLVLKDINLKVRNG